MRLRNTWPLMVAMATLPGQAQLPSSEAEPLLGARSLALSPDGSRLCFVYHGDLWVVPSGGGSAVRITNHVEMEDNPVWSPDGKYIAFSSNRFGSNAMFVIPANGGSVQRLTFHSSGGVPSDWSPDGKKILFTSRRDDANNQILTLDVATGRIESHLLDPVSISNPKFAPDGKSVLYNRLGFPWVRARYQGSAAQQIWRVDLASKKRSVVRNNGFQHLWSQFALGGDTVLAVTVSEKTPSTVPVDKTIARIVDNANRTPNVYAIDGPNRARRITDFVSTPVRFLTVSRDGKTAAYDVDGTTYLHPLGQDAKPIKITGNLDDKTTQEERLILTANVEDLALSPDNKSFAFVVRGEIWTVPLEKGKGPNADDATQLTDWAGLDRQPVWTPDGKTLFFTSDREGAERLYRLDVATRNITAVTRDDNDVLAMQLTPDKKSLGFWKSGLQGGLYEVPVEGGEPKLVISRPDNYQFGNATDYAYSPDNRYIAYSQQRERSGYYYWESSSNVFVFDRQTGQTHNVTKLSSSHGSPAFSPDGKYLLFRSNRDGDAVYIVPLQQEDARTTESEMKWEKPKETPKVEIDFNGIEFRIRPFLRVAGISSYEYDKETGDIIYLAGGNLNRVGYDGANPRPITSTGGISAFSFSYDGKLIQFRREGTLNTLNPRARDEQKNVAFRADWTRDLRLERRAAFEQFWRSFNRSFYDPQFHGRDWVALKKRYEKFLPSVGHRSEFATVLNMMVGELEASHAEVSPGFGGGGNSVPTAHLGFDFDYGHTGAGIKIARVPERTPGSFAKTKLEAGEVVTHVNGKAASITEAFFRDVLNGQIGRDLTLTVQGKDGKSREVKYRALSSGEYGGLQFENRLRERRKYVEEKSGGKLTYVHISGMGGSQLELFMKQVWEYTAGKKGLIIDVRNNGGGNTSDQIIDILERQPNAQYKLRNQNAILGPGQAFASPIVVMCAESSFSNAEMFPAAMKARGLAKTVGMPTPGYVIYTYGLPLLDGTSARMPSTGVYRLNGTPLENMGEVPDFVIDISPEDYLANRDPQLDKAIEVLLRDVK